ncbi:hypothetical protein ACFY64_13675 [Streptomyces collinus]
MATIARRLGFPEPWTPASRWIHELRRHVDQDESPDADAQERLIAPLRNI